MPHGPSQPRPSTPKLVLVRPIVLAHLGRAKASTLWFGYHGSPTGRPSHHGCLPGPRRVHGLISGLAATICHRAPLNNGIDGLSRLDELHGLVPPRSRRPRQHHINQSPAGQATVPQPILGWRLCSVADAREPWSTTTCADEEGRGRGLVCA